MLNRRDFLQGVALEEPQSEAVNETALLRVAQRAMATRFEVLLPFGMPHAQEAAEAALAKIDRLEAQLTVYRETSEVSRLNQLPSMAPVPVEERLCGLLELAARIHTEPAGA